MPGLVDSARQSKARAGRGDKTYPPQSGWGWEGTVREEAARRDGVPESMVPGPWGPLSPRPIGTAGLGGCDFKV
ncbi:hypothetical protein MishRS11D_10160 [Methylomagnum ishizawai]|nr:hypothetical protein MishRS11D_10160 [Methylomagnum ishizawai]